MDSRERYEKLTKGLGLELRDFFNGALKDADHLPGKRQLRADIEEAFADYEGVLNFDKLAEAFIDFAQRGQERGARFNLRGHVDETVIALVTKLEKADRLIDAPEDEEVDAAALADDFHYGDRIGGELNRKRDKERAEAQEILRKAGVSL